MPKKAPAKTDHPAVKKPAFDWPRYLLVGIVAFGLGFLVHSSFFSSGLNFIGFNNNGGSIDIGKLKQVQGLVNSKFDGDIDKSKQSDGAIAGLVATLGDPYTVYLDADANKQLSSDLNGTLSGIGVEVGIKNNALTVITPIDDTPAQKAGLRAGDIIAKINREDTTGMSIDTAVTKIRGKEGTTVKLTIIHANDSPRDIEITRANITVPSVKVDQQGDVGILRIRRFGDDTADLVDNAATTFKDKGVRGIVIDLRGNPGGYLQSAVDVASQFIKDGVVVEERSRGRTTDKKSVSGSGVLTDLPVIVLIDKGSASAAEILAGALHDHNRAQLVGETSFGKGSVQEIISLGNDTSLKVTVAHWYTPNGVNIGKEGIKPDIPVTNSDADYQAGRDPQFDKAMELINSKI